MMVAVLAPHLIIFYKKWWSSWNNATILKKELSLGLFS